MTATENNRPKKFYEDEVYIKMCSKATPIQDIWQSMHRDKSNIDDPNSSNFFWNHHFDEGYEGSFYVNDEGEISCVDYEYCCESLTTNEDIWLPRQDELQEMVDWNYTFSKIGSEYFSLYEFNLLSIPERMPKEIKTRDILLEKLLLKMVMYHKFNKTWNGEEWI